MGHGKSSGFSGGGMTIQQKAEAYAAAAAADYKSSDYLFNDPLMPDNLPYFVTEKLSQHELSAINIGDAVTSIKRETEKAVLINYETDYGNITLWAPKSVIKTEEQFRADFQRQATRQYVNDSYYNYLRNTAKAAGVKLGSVKKWDKIKKKLTQSGVSFMDRDAYASSTG